MPHLLVKRLRGCVRQQAPGPMTDLLTVIRCPDLTPPEGVWENIKNGMGNLAAGNAGELAAIVRARAAVAARR